MAGSVASTTARSTAFSSSRTLPGQLCSIRICITSGWKLRTELPCGARYYSFSRQYLVKKWLTSAGMASLRSRHGGHTMVIRFSRSYRSSREGAWCTGFVRSALVAARMRTSTRTGSVAPSGMNSFSWMTRRLLGLHVGRDGADLVEENGSAVGHLEIALLGVDGAGEGALHMAEQRGFQQVGGQRAAVHGHEQALRARRIGVDGFGNQLLARAGFAGDQDGGAAAGHLPHQLEQAQHAAGSGTTSGAGNAQARSGGTSGDAPPRLYLCYCMYKCASNGMKPRATKTAANTAWTSKSQRWCSTIRTTAASRIAS